MKTATKKTTVKKATKRGAATPKKSAVAQKKVVKKDLSKTYNEFKEFEGQQYTGMKIGRSHKWNYDAGVWRETKITPDLWEISYAVTKRRAGRAPEGSGVPVGTGYHWYIMAHQNVTKLNANDYTTTMAGLKLKLAHKRADKDKWSLSGKTQRKHLIEFLQEIIAQLEKEPASLDFTYNEKHYLGEAIPIGQTCHDGLCEEYDIILNDASMGIIRRMKKGWKIDGIEDKKFVGAIGDAIIQSSPK
ncbi:hypothetical protein [Chitinophaga sp. S165]|uniref:hypothetical protein n=1 Tax=Chitinophaga sp. S165 TaxID=2135462 RepID=UPI000D71B363|nr:hypothetical protein [Chitinophaga sp. S165]PWV45005.1 hypothetical protein C7475_11647 [Chitinophaga sp. S165]